MAARCQLSQLRKLRGAGARGVHVGLRHFPPPVAAPRNRFSQPTDNNNTQFTPCPHKLGDTHTNRMVKMLRLRALRTTDAPNPQARTSCPPSISASAASSCNHLDRKPTFPDDASTLLRPHCIGTAALRQFEPSRHSGVHACSAATLPRSRSPHTISAFRYRAAPGHGGRVGPRKGVAPPCAAAVREPMGRRGAPTPCSWAQQRATSTLQQAPNAVHSAARASRARGKGRHSPARRL